MMVDSVENFDAAKLAGVFGPTYRGVPVPEEFRIDWGKELTRALAWRKGVDATLEARRHD